MSTGARPPSLRTCVGCRGRAPRSELLRVVAVSGTLVPDPARRLPGRGAHVHHDPACLALAERRRAWPRALRVAGPLDAADLYDHCLTPSTAQDGEPDAPGAGQRSTKDDTTHDLSMSIYSR